MKVWLMKSSISLVALLLICGCSNGSSPGSSSEPVSSFSTSNDTGQFTSEVSGGEAVSSNEETISYTETTSMEQTSSETSRLPNTSTNNTSSAVITSSATSGSDTSDATSGESTESTGSEAVSSIPKYNPNLKADDGTYIKGGESGWVLDWTDDFNGTRLNTTMWAYQDYMVVNESLQNNDPFRNVPIKVDKKVVSLDGAGHLKIGLLQDEDGTYLQGGIQVMPAYDRTYGYFEIRCILPKTSCALAAFWLMPRKGFTSDLPTGGMEVDIFETPYYLTSLADGAYIGTHRNGRISTGYHYGGYGNKHVGIGTTYFPDIPSNQGCGYYDEYHIYGLKWTPEKMSVYVDGVLAYEHDGNGFGVSKVAEYMILSTGWNSWGASNLELAVVPSYFTVDWVRVYKNNFN